MRVVTHLISTLLLVCATHAAAEAGGLFGRWQLNNELSTDVQDTGGGIDLSGANVSTTVTVGGIPLPTGGSRAPSDISKLPSKDPDVLRCAELTIEAVGEDVLLTYTGVGSETLSKGNVQGTKTRWSQRKLTTRYATTSRKVSRTFEIQEDGRLLVTVKLDPNRAKAAVHKRVFDRVQ